MARCQGGHAGQAAARLRPRRQPRSRRQQPAAHLSLAGSRSAAASNRRSASVMAALPHQVRRRCGSTRRWNSGWNSRPAWAGRQAGEWWVGRWPGTRMGGRGMGQIARDAAGSMAAACHASAPSTRPASKQAAPQPATFVVWRRVDVDAEQQLGRQLRLPAGCPGHLRRARRAGGPHRAPAGVCFGRRPAAHRLLQALHRLLRHQVGGIPHPQPPQLLVRQPPGGEEQESHLLDAQGLKGLGRGGSVTHQHCLRLELVPPDGNAQRRACRRRMAALLSSSGTGTSSASP